MGRQSWGASGLNYTCQAGPGDVTAYAVRETSSSHGGRAAPEPTPLGETQRAKRQKRLQKQSCTDCVP